MGLCIIGIKGGNPMCLVVFKGKLVYNRKEIDRIVAKSR